MHKQPLGSLIPLQESTCFLNLPLLNTFRFYHNLDGSTLLEALLKQSHSLLLESSAVLSNLSLVGMFLYLNISYGGV